MNKATNAASAKAIPLRVLIVEDSEDDAILLLHELRRGGYNPQYQLVDRYETMKQALDEQHWDIVITDHRLPNFSSQAALDTVLEHGEDIPVIIVSGSIGEDFAVNVMRSGAQDYVMKNNLTRLVPAIERELREKKIRLARRQAEDTIEYMANHDSLTGLNNRTEFEHRLQFALESVKDRNIAHALLYVDLDQFKIINDTCGHAAGDEFLIQLTEQLLKPVRETDTVARLGGDEFGILLESCPLGRAKRIAEKILSLIKSFKFQWHNNTFSISASIGLVMITDAQHSYLDVLSEADMACFVAKDLGRNRLHVYNKDDISLIQKHGEMKWVARVQQAIEQDRFLLHRQRIVSLKNAQDMPAYELLLRMHDEEGKLVMPGEFIPAVERYNMMQTVDRLVIEKAVAFIRDEMRRNRVAKYFINLSGNSLSDDSIASFLRDQIHSSGVPPELICFEITETAAISNVNSALTLIRDIRSQGCEFALDDFGAGLSSFSYLKTLNVDYLKIDGSFILGVVENPMDVVIVESITKIGHVAGLKIIAEFVESDAIRDKLVDMGIDLAQGYGIEHPKPLETVSD